MSDRVCEACGADTGVAKFEVRERPALCHGYRLCATCAELAANSAIAELTDIRIRAARQERERAEAAAARRAAAALVAELEASKSGPPPKPEPDALVELREAVSRCGGVSLLPHQVMYALDRILRALEDHERRLAALEGAMTDDRPYPVFAETRKQEARSVLTHVDERDCFAVKAGDEWLVFTEGCGPFDAELAEWIVEQWNKRATDD